MLQIAEICRPINSNFTGRQICIYPTYVLTMRFFVKYFFLFFWLSISYSTFGQRKNTVNIIVLEQKTGQYLPNAYLLLMPENKPFATDNRGKIEISDLHNNITYSLTASFVGYLPQTLQFRIDTLLKPIVFRLVPDIQQLKSIEVQMTLKHVAPTDAISVLEKEKLDEQRGLSLGQMLKVVAGVNAIQTGPSIFKPMIHGLYGNRVAIQQNGVRQEGQQWGMEHAPEIDPFAAARVSVVKGAGSVRYGADAIGGIILVEPAPLPTEPILRGEANMAAVSNGRMGAAALRLEGNHEKIPALAWRVQGSTRRGGNVKTPKYFLDNTGLAETSFTGTLAWNKQKWGAELFYSLFTTKLGIFSGSHIGNTTDLANALSRPDSTFNYHFSYKIARPYQDITHHLAKAKIFYLFPKHGKLTWQFSAQSNRRLEYDLHKPRGVSASYNRPELSFFIATQHSELVWDYAPTENWSVTAGLNGQIQTNSSSGRFLIPDFRSYATGAFSSALWQKNKWQAEIGLRYDLRSMGVTQNKNRADSSFLFKGWTAALGLNYQVNNVLKIGIQSASAWRAPSVNELYSNGVHHGTASFEQGKADMRPERAWNSSINVHLEHEKLMAEFSLYGNYIKDFMYLQPQAPQTVLTVRGAFPYFKYTQANAWFRGMDFSGEYHLTEQWHVSSKIAIVRAYNLSDNDYLIFTPADRYQYALSYHWPDAKKRSQTSVGVNVTQVSRQNRTPENVDYAPAPKGYVLYGLSAGAALMIGQQKFKINATADNILNTAYRDYLNRFRYFAYDVGRSFSLRLKYEF